MAAQAARQLRRYQSDSSRIEPAISRYRLTFGVALIMRAALLILALFLAFGFEACQLAKSGTPRSSAQKFAAAATTSPTRKPDFTAEIKPIFQARCLPCHFPGGKVYDRMPFDKPETITRLGTKLFTRIKDEKEQRLIRAFLAP